MSPIESNVYLRKIRVDLEDINGDKYLRKALQLLLLLHVVVMESFYSMMRGKAGGSLVWGVAGDPALLQLHVECIGAGGQLFQQHSLADQAEDLKLGVEWTDTETISINNHFQSNFHPL